MKKKIVAIMACAMMLLSAGASAEMTAGTYTGEGQGIGCLLYTSDAADE